MNKNYRAWMLAIICILFFRLDDAASAPVDLVYTWVDGSDAEWQKSKRARALQCLNEIRHVDANSKNRFRDRDELKYSLRSVNKYAQFVRRIFIVTCGQRPSWMKPHPKITFIDHQEIFKFKNHLPTFNSQAIEAHLHRIPDLSEQYIYLNDDFLFMSPVSERDFYDRNGKIRVFLGNSEIKKNQKAESSRAFYASLRNTDQFLDKVYGVKIRKHILHAPYVMKKSVVKQLEAVFPEILRTTSSHPFRSPQDFTLTNGMIPYYALYTGFAVTAHYNSAMLMIGSDYEKNSERLQRMNNNKLQMICIEDDLLSDDPIIDSQVISALEKRFPEKAPWEK